MNSNSGDILLNYRINQKFGVATGIGIAELSGNGFNSLGNFYHEREILKIPLLATLDYKISEKIKNYLSDVKCGKIEDEFNWCLKV